MQVKSTSTQKEWALPEQDTYPAVCIRIIDLGTQENKKFGNSSRKAKFVFELVGTAHVFNEELGPQPFVVSKDYTQSIGEKSNLRKDCEAWLNRTLTEKELDNFDLDMLLGKPCFLTIIHNVSGNGKTYANVKSITAPMKGFKVATPVNEVFLFEIGKMGWKEMFNKLWDFDKKKIETTPEYLEAMNATV